MRKNVMPSDALPADIATPHPDSARKFINWDIVKTLYLQDVPHQEIADHTGASIYAIRCKAWRERWVEQKLTPDEEPRAPSFQDLVSQFQFNMGLSVVAATRYYANLDAKIQGGRDARDWEIARQTLIQSGRMLFGLDKDDKRAPGSWGAGAQSGSPIIDVTPVSLTPTPTKAP